MENRTSKDDILDFAEIKDKDSQFDALLKKAAADRKAELDAKNIFVSEELIARTLNKIEEYKETERTNVHEKNGAGHTWYRKYRKPVITTLAAAAALFAVVFLVGGTSRLFVANSIGSDNASFGGMTESAQNVNQSAPEAADRFDNAAMPEDMPLPESSEGKNTSSQAPGTALEESTVPELLYGGETESAVSDFTVQGENGEQLQITFDYPQKFVYSCGREGNLLYLLTAGGEQLKYQYRFYEVNFEEQSYECLAEFETTGQVTWISWQDGEVTYGN